MPAPDPVLLDEREPMSAPTATTLAALARACARIGQAAWVARVGLTDDGRFELVLQTAGKRRGFGCLLSRFAEQGVLGELIRAFVFHRFGVVLPAGADGGRFVFALPADEAQAARALHAFEAVVEALKAGRTDILVRNVVDDGHGDSDPLVKDCDEPGHGQAPASAVHVVSVQIPDFATDLLDIDASLACFAEPALQRLLDWMGARMGPFVASSIAARQGGSVCGVDILLVPALKCDVLRGDARAVAMLGRVSALVTGLRPAAIAAPYPLGSRLAHGLAVPVFDGTGHARGLAEAAARLLAACQATPAAALPFDPFLPVAAGTADAICDVLLAQGADALPTWLRRSRHGAVGLQAAIGWALDGHAKAGAPVIAALCDRAGVLSALEIRAGGRADASATSAAAAGLARAAAPAIEDAGQQRSNVWDLVFCDERRWDALAVIDPSSGATASYAGLHAGALRRAGWLAAQGVVEGHVVVCALKDGIACVEVLLACLRLGAIFAPLNVTLADQALAEQLRLLAPQLVLADADIANERPDLVRCHGARVLEPLAGPQQAEADAPAPVRTSAQDFAAVILFTSGSTGVPKSVVHSHADLLNCARNYAQVVLALTAQDVLYSPSRVFFSYGLNNLVMTLCTGAAFVTATPLADAAAMLDVLDRWQVSVLMSVPVVYKRLLDAAAGRKRPGALRCMVSAGETLPPALYWRLRDTFGIEVLDGIGTTEVLSTFVSNRPGDARGGCTGRVVPGFEITLVDEHGGTCAIGQAGSLRVRGNTVASGYRCGAADFAEAGFDTRDMFFMDALGRLHYLGRANSVVKINGCWFSADALEQALQAHAAVRECAVAFEPDEFGLPRPRAYVVLADGADASQETWDALRRHSRERLGKDHYPHLFTAARALPRTASGKLMRNALRPAGTDGALATDAQERHA